MKKFGKNKMYPDTNLGKFVANFIVLLLFNYYTRINREIYVNNFFQSPLVNEKYIHTGL